MIIHRHKEKVPQHYVLGIESNQIKAAENNSLPNRETQKQTKRQILQCNIYFPNFQSSFPFLFY